MLLINKLIQLHFHTFSYGKSDLMRLGLPYLFTLHVFMETTHVYTFSKSQFYHAIIILIAIHVRNFTCILSFPANIGLILLQTLCHILRKMFRVFFCVFSIGRCKVFSCLFDLKGKIKTKIYSKRLSQS